MPLTYQIKRKGHKGPQLLFRNGKPAGTPTTPELEFWSEIKRLHTELTKAEQTVAFMQCRLLSIGA